MVRVPVENFRHAEVISRRLTIAIRNELCLEVNQCLCTLACTRCLATRRHVRRRIGKEYHVKLAQTAIGHFAEETQRLLVQEWVDVAGVQVYPHWLVQGEKITTVAKGTVVVG